MKFLNAHSIFIAFVYIQKSRKTKKEKKTKTKIKMFSYIISVHTD